MLSFITIVHELGHLVVAKCFGVYCKEFAIGMGPKLWSKKGKETVYSIRAILIGGFVSMAGETDDQDPDIEALNIPKERTLKNIAKWKQMLVMFAGIFMNLLTAVLIYSLIILNIGQYTIANKPIIESIKEDYPAYSSGLLPGDIIEEAELSNGVSIKPASYAELTTFLTTYYEGEGSWTLTVNRDGKTLKYEVTPKYYPEEERYIIGIAFSNAATEVVEINILNCFKYGFLYTIEMIKMIFISLGSLIRGIGLENMSGPVGVYKVVQESITYGFDYYIELLALISVNVGIFNAIPIPAFDGGRALILLVEVIIGRNLSNKVENAILTASWVLIITLMVFVTYNDIIKLIGG